MFAVGTALVSSAAQAQRRALSTTAPTVVSRAVVGQTLPETNLNLTLALPLRNLADLQSLLQQQQDPQSPNYRKFLTPTQFTQRFAPTAADYQAVIDFAKANGLTITRTTTNRLLLYVRGAKSKVQTAFQTTLALYQHPTEARTYFAPATDPSVPADLKVNEVQGLDNYSRPRPRLVRSPATTQPAPRDLTPQPLSWPPWSTNWPPGSGGYGGSATAVGHGGDPMKNHYAQQTPLTGKGQSLALIEFDDYYDKDVTNYVSYIGYTGRWKNNVQRVKVTHAGSPTPSSPGVNNTEVALDIEMAISVAPDLDKILVYEGGDMWSVCNQIAVDNTCKQVSCSWGVQAPPTYVFWGASTLDAIFMQMCVQGQSIFAASGDYDAYIGPSAVLVNNSTWKYAPTPADSPYVTSVGGVVIKDSIAAPNNIMAWNWEITPSAGGPIGQGSGGGISPFYNTPWWQTNVSMAANSGSSQYRNFPDIAALADGIAISSDNGKISNVGGTSAAAPLVAAVCALANQQLSLANQPPIGLMNPGLYAIGAGAHFTDCLFDIVWGDNYLTNGMGYRAVTGFDLCTGWGEPTGTNFLNALAPYPGFLNSTTNISVLPGRNVTLNAVVVGQPPFGYQWLFNGAKTGPSSSTLELTNVDPSATGNYTLVVTNSYGSITGLIATLNVTSSNNLAPSFTGITNVTIPRTASSPARTTITIIDPYGMANAGQMGVTSSDSTIATFDHAASSESAAETNHVQIYYNLTGNRGTTTFTVTVTNQANLAASTSFTITTIGNVPPSFSLPTNTIYSQENGGAVAMPGCVASLSAGPASESSQTWSFSITSLSGNISFKTAPAIDKTGKLTFQAGTNSWGTNLLQIVMKDSGGTNYSCQDSATNTLTLAIPWADQVSQLSWFTNCTTLENVSASTVLKVYDADADPTSETFVLGVSDTNLLKATISRIDSGSSSTNECYVRLSLVPVTNMFGTATVTLTAVGTTTVSNSFTVTVKPVNHAPSYVFNTNATRNVTLQLTNDASTTYLALAEDAGPVTISGFGASMSTGPANESTQTWTFTLIAATNLLYKTAPRMTSDGDLVFQTATNQYGTNLVKVVMKDNGGTANGGVDSYTNSYTLIVTPVNDPPYFVGLTNRTLLEDAPGSLTTTVSLLDVDSPVAGESVQVYSSNTNLVAVTLLSTAAVNPTNETLALGFSLGTNAFGSATITLVATDNSDTNLVLVTTNTFTVTVTPVNDPPSFTLPASRISIIEDLGPKSYANFATNLCTGPTNEGSQTWSFTLRSTTNFVYLTAPAISTNGTLTFQTATNACGTNTITVVMKDSGGTGNGGKDSFTNTFTLAVDPINDPPYFVGLTNRVITEDAVSNLTTKVTLIDVDTPVNTEPVQVYSSDTNLVAVTLLTTNVLNNTNTAFTLGFTLGTNLFGSAIISLVATDNANPTNALIITNTFTVVVNPVNDAPTFSLATNLIVVMEDAGATTNFNLATSLCTGPTNESNQTWTFSVLSSTNVAYRTAPVMSTNGALRFQTATNAFGTNTLTIVMKDNGGTWYGGKDSCTNILTLIVLPVNDPPYFVGATDRTFTEDCPTNLTTRLSLIDVDSPASTEALQVYSSNTNLLTVAISATNLVAATNELLTLTFTAATNQFGTATITLVATDNSDTNLVLYGTNSFKVTIKPVNDAPSFTISTNLLVVSEDAGVITNLNFATSMSTGPTNEANQSWIFTVISSTNFAYKVPPTMSTNGTLWFQTATNQNGTNTLTVVMKDNGGIADGGKDSFTNTLTLIVLPVNDAPYFVGLTNRNLLQNSTSNLTTKVTLIDVDTPVSTETVQVFNSNTNLLSVALLSSTVVTSTNKTITLGFTLATNQNGTSIVALVATDPGDGTNTLVTTNSFAIVVKPVNQAPSFSLSTNLIYLLENAAAVTLPNFAINANTGPTNESSQTWTFMIYSGTNCGYKIAPAISTNGTLTFQTATNAYGTNTIKVVMKDNGGTSNGGSDSATNTFVLAVTHVNQPPIIVGLTDKTIKQNGRTNLVFSILDPDSTAFNLASSVADTNLISAAITGSGSSRILQVVAATNLSGATTITLSADDGFLTNRVTFNLAVAPVNQTPSFTLLVTNLTVTRFSTPVTLANAITNISVGPSNENSQTASVLVTNSNNGLFSSQPAIDSSGTLTFTPKANGGTVTVGVRVKDSGGTANGAIDTSAAQYFTIIIPNNGYAPLQGHYAGLFFATNLYDNASSGYLEINLATNGVYTAQLLNAGNVVNITGQFSATNSTAAAITNGYTLTLNINTASSATENITGTVAANSWSVPLNAWRNVNSAASPTSFAGEFLIAVPGLTDPTAGPAGDSFLSLIVSNNGTASIDGWLADNTHVTQTTCISHTGQLPVYLSKGASESMSGWIDLGATQLGTNSYLAWISQANLGGLYPAGFTNETLAVGAKYNSALTNSLPNGSYTVVLSGGNLSQALTNAITITNNIVQVDSNATNGLTLSITRASGQISGQFNGPGGVTPLDGVILQNTNAARGFFMGTSQGGKLRLE